MDRYVSSVAKSRCCADPVTPLPASAAPVFRERPVFRPGDAPKATRVRPQAARFGKGICHKAAQAQESGNLDEKQRIVEDFCNLDTCGSCNFPSKLG